MKIGDTEVKPIVLADYLVDKMAGETPPGQIAVIMGEAEGAIPNGSRIEKIWEGEGDTFPLGTQGEVLSSIGPIPEDADADMAGEYGYYILFDPFPQTPVFTRGKKIALIKEK